MTKIAQGLLIGLMALGSVFLWIGIPVGWLILASRLTDTSAPSLGPYVLIIFAIPVSMVIVARVLRRLDGVYTRVSGGPIEEGPVRASWLKSMRGERESTRRLTVLDTVMIWSVSVALVAFGIWFFAFAGSSLPGS